MPRTQSYYRFEENFPGSSIAPDEFEFMSAMAAYQTRYGRRYPTWVEVLMVAKSLGYRKAATAVGLPDPPKPKPKPRRKPRPTPPEAAPCAP